MPRTEHGPVVLPDDQDRTGRTLGDEELKLLEDVIRSGTLTSTKGHYVRDLEDRLCASLDVDYAQACSSGTAAIHAAVAAIDPEPGDEVITSPITDMGAITPILYQSAVPVFADVDPRTCNLTARSVSERLSKRTKAVIVTHLFGNPAEIRDIVEVAAARNVPVIEDCAQAYLASVNGKSTGTFGSMACFSLQQGKHITSGEGGLVVTNDDSMAERIRLFINKAWPYGDPNPDHEFLALNYRMTELQGAVALAQFEKLEGSVRSRIEMADRLTAHVSRLPGVSPPHVLPDAVHTYWRYCLMVDPLQIAGGAIGLGGFLKARGISSAPRYIKKPAFECRLFTQQRTFGASRFPFTEARPEALDYSPDRFRGTYTALANVLVLPWNERYDQGHVDALAEALTAGVEALRVHNHA